MMRDACLSDRPLTHSACVITALLPLALSDRASADESGVSFWLQGQFGSFAAAPSNPGLSFESTYYHATAEASPSVSFARGGGIQTGAKSPTDFVMLTPTYVFATPVLGGQASIGMSALYGRNTTSVSATLTGPGGASLSGSSSDYVLGFGDLYPAASLKWNRDVHNFMVYATTGIPVGVYDPTRLASMGLGHWAADAGAGYTYLNEQIGFEWSAVAGLITPNTRAASTRTWIGRFRRISPTNSTLAPWAMSTTSSRPTAARAPGSANSNHALRESGRRSGFSFQSRTAKDTSISEPITSSTPATGWKDGRGTSRSRLRRRNRSRGNGRFRGSPRSHADRGLRAARRLSSPERYRNADQRQTDGDHQKARGPRSKPGATSKRVSAHKQHSDGNRIGEAQRQSHVADQNERNDDRERRQEAEQADPQRAEPVACRQSRTLGLGQSEQSLPHQFQLVRRQDRGQRGWQCVRDDAMRVSDIGGRAHGSQLHGVAAPLVEASHQKHAGVDDSPGQVAAECGEEHGPNLDAVRGYDAECQGEG